MATQGLQSSVLWENFPQSLIAFAGAVPAQGLPRQIASSPGLLAGVVLKDHHRLGRHKISAAKPEARRFARQSERVPGPAYLLAPRHPNSGIRWLLVSRFSLASVNVNAPSKRAYRLYKQGQNALGVPGMAL